MTNKLKNNALACFLLGILAGIVGTIGAQAVMGGSHSHGIFQSSKSQNNFDAVPYCEDGDVLITPTGEKYHYDWCKSQKRAKRTQRVKQADAQAAGLEACTKCVSKY